MIVQLEPSAVVNPFVVQTHSDRVRQAIYGASLIATHAIACVEACATFARVGKGEREKPHASRHFSAASANRLALVRASEGGFPHRRRGNRKSSRRTQLQC